MIDTAVREFREEVGFEPNGPYIDLGWIRQKSGKKVYGWAFKGDYDASQPLKSNLFELEWPPRSGRRQTYPEIDKAVFFTFSQARIRLKQAQHLFLDRLEAWIRQLESHGRPADGAGPVELRSR